MLDVVEPEILLQLLVLTTTSCKIEDVLPPWKIRNEVLFKKEKKGREK